MLSLPPTILNPRPWNTRTVVYMLRIQYIVLFVADTHLDTFPWPFMRTMLEMMKACTLLQDGTKCAELRERDGLTTACRDQKEHK